MRELMLITLRRRFPLLNTGESIREFVLHPVLIIILCDHVIHTLYTVNSDQVSVLN